VNFDDMHAAVQQAKATMSLADGFAHRMAAMLIGRLQHVPSWVLKDLKRELRDFNIHTGEWKK
jgi:hypothetical protein